MYEPHCQVALVVFELQTFLSRDHHGVYCHLEPCLEGTGEGGGRDGIIRPLLGEKEDTIPLFRLFSV